MSEEKNNQKRDRYTGQPIQHADPLIKKGMTQSVHY
jgi:hypothetical protein